MKILFFQWHSFMNQGIERALNNLKVEYDVFFYQFSDWEHDADFQEKLRSELQKTAYDCVFSVNFAPLIAQVCEELSLCYVSWVYDSPLHIRDLDTLKYSCNQIYFFDRGQADAYRGMGIDARHMPLAVDAEVFRSYICEKGGDEYQTDISLVGQLYQTEYSYFSAPLNPYLRGYLEGIVNSQMKVCGGYLIPELITEELLDKMNAEYAKVSKDGFQMGNRELEYMLACEATGRERYLALALLSKNHQVTLYSKDEDKRLMRVKCGGYVDYYKQMPGVFAQSRINLNISLKTIRTGIPLRVLDIMGCGGFVLSNYQEELAEYMKIGEECEVYENLEDLVLKAEFYLKNEDLRQKIALAGLKKVERDFTFEERMGKIIKNIRG